MTSLRRRLASFSLFALGLAWSAVPANAQVSLVTEACPGVAAGRLQELVALELGTVAAGRTIGPAVVVLACQGERIAISATEARTGHQARAEVLAGGTTGPALLRLLALSVSELLVTNEAPVEKKATMIQESPPAPPPEPARPLRASATASLRRVARPATWLKGFALGADFAFTPHVALAVEGRGEIGATATSLTTVDWRVAGASVALLAGAGRGAWRIACGPGVEVGLVQLAGHDSATGAKGNSLSHPWVGLLGGLRASRALGTRAFLLGRIDAGWVVHRVAGDASNGSALVELRGGWVGMSIGAGMQL